MSTEPPAVKDAAIRPAHADEKEPVPDVSVPGGAVGKGASESGWLPLGFNPAVVDTLSTLYGHWTSGVRELYANLVASCKRARAEYGADPAIVVTIDGRTMTLADIDSCGMSKKVFEEGVAVAGNTGNVDPRSPGQWGLGSLAFVMVSDEMLIESHSRATGERFAVQALRGGKFRTGGLAEPSFGWHGTRMTLVMRDGLEVQDAVKTVAKIAEMSGVPTALRVYGGRDSGDGGGSIAIVDADGEHYANGLDGASVLYEKCDGEKGRVVKDAPWVQGFADYLASDGPTSSDDRSRVVLGLGGRGLREAIVSEVRRAGFDVGDAKEYAGKAVGGRRRQCLLADGGGVVILHVENDDLEVAAALGISGERRTRRWSRDDPVNGMRGPNKTWLAGMPIEARTPGCLDGTFSRVYVHAKNERVYSPTPDRERLTEDAEKRLNADVEALVLCELAVARFGSLGEYLSDYGNRTVEAALHIRSPGNAVTVDDLPRETREYMERLPLEIRQRLGLAPRNGNTSAGVGIVDDREMRIARAASAPINVFGTPRTGDRLTLWSAARCIGAVSGMKHRCTMTCGTVPDGKRPILIVARSMLTRKAAAVAEWCARNEAGRRAVVFRPTKDNPHSIDEYISLGAEEIDAYMERNGIKPLSADAAREAAGRARDPATLMVYGGPKSNDRFRGYASSADAVKIDPGKAGADIVWCSDKSDMDAMRSIAAVLPGHARAARCARRPGRATPFAEYAKAGGRAACATTAGRLSGSAIARTGRRVVMVEYDGDADGLADLMRTAASSYRTVQKKRWWSDAHEEEVILPPMAVVGRGKELAMCAAYLHSAGAKFGVCLRGGYGWGAPDYVRRASAGIHEYLGDAEPDWLDRLRPDAKSESEARTLVASVLHGHLASRYRRGASRGVGSEDANAGGAIDGPASGTGGRSQ